ncbi:hypothetical protein EO93_06765 [Methanosarcina sp. 1.H.A.2.2]|nr:hypothetical protein EO93_06765 [Methanosarcina sp. 1.H.A.2.2]
MFLVFLAGKVITVLSCAATSGGTNIGAGMSTANSHLINSGDSEHAWMVILLTDGQGTYSNTYTQQAINNNITVYTVGLGSDVDTALLTGIATATGGQYFPVSSAEDLPDVFRTISEEIEPTDTDEDGIPDITETTGFRDGFGNWYYTDPNNSDTDGDGLLDGEEAGELVDYDGKQYFQLFSDPTKADSDGDGVDDLNENEYGIEPLISDTDGDGLFDGDEFGIGTDPLLADTDGDDYNDYVEYYDADHDPLIYDIRYSYLEIGREVALGAVLGEWGGDDHDSLYYMAGWMLSGFIAVGDVRDIASSIAHGDGLGTLLNALSLIPGYGDSAKVTATIGKFVTKHPHMIFDVAGFVVKHVDESIDIVRKTYGDVIVDGLRAKGLNDDEITQLVKKDVDLAELHIAYRIGDDLVSVTLKRQKHVIDRHVTGVIKGKPNKPTDFFPTGHEVRPGITTPKVMDVQDVEKMIKESMQYGTREVKDDVFIFTWNPQEFGITEIRTIVNKDGLFITSYPTSGINVIRVVD